ncbi:MAG: FtsX-like permease family protein, partial [Elusimicrobiota bacterium]
FREDIRAKILGAQPHILILGAGGDLEEGDWSSLFQGVPDIAAWSPFVMGQALVKHGSATQGVVAKGVDPLGEPAVTGLQAKLAEGRWENLSAAPDGRPSIFLGRELAKILRAGVGDDVFVSAPGQDFNPLNPLLSLPALHGFTVAGILQTGLYDYDSTLAIMSLESAQKVFGLGGRYTGLGVRTKDADDSPALAAKIQKNAGTKATARSWLSLNQNLFAALRLEKIVMFIILALITLVAAFNIVSNLLLVTAQKIREIGILKAMGAPRRSVEKIFLVKGMMMGGMGTAIGAGLGVAISFALKKYQFVQLPADVYYVDTLPVRLVPGDVALVAFAALLIVLLATLYPARLAAKLDALDAIRR